MEGLKQNINGFERPIQSPDINTTKNMFGDLKWAMHRRCHYIVMDIKFRMDLQSSFCNKKI